MIRNEFNIENIKQEIYNKVDEICRALCSLYNTSDKTINDECVFYIYDNIINDIEEDCNEHKNNDEYYNNDGNYSYVNAIGENSVIKYMINYINQI